MPHRGIHKYACQPVTLNGLLERQGQILKTLQNETMTKQDTATKKDDQKNGPAQQGNKNQMVIYCIIFIIGFLAGVAFTVFKSNHAAPAAVSTADNQPPHAHDDETQQAILNLEAEVTANPKNFQAWTRLGNLYYDTEQPPKAIGAYLKAIELHEADANLLTDLGVMYRKANQPQKAIEYFDLARQKDSSHLPSRFNKGIVMMYDLNDPQGAIASWEELLRIDPQAKASSGEFIHDMIDRIKTEQAKTN